MAVLWAGAQNVGINTDGTPVSDPKALVEIKKAGYSKLKIRTTGFSADTAVLELSNRSSAGTGTDFLFSHIQENGLVISSRSDLLANTRDSLMTITPQGNTRFRSLRGIGTRQVTANANGEITASAPLIQTLYMSIPGMAFQPRFNSSVTNFTAMDANLLSSFTAGSNNFLVAPVNLPHGARVTSFKAYFVDNSAIDIFFTLGLTPLTSFFSSPMATVTSSGLSGSSSTMSTLEETTIASPVIDNINNTYYITSGPPGGCCWDGINLRIKGILIAYTQ